MELYKSLQRTQGSIIRAMRGHPQRISLQITNLSKTKLFVLALVYDSAEKAFNLIADRLLIQSWIWETWKNSALSCNSATQDTELFLYTDLRGAL